MSQAGVCVSGKSLQMTCTLVLTQREKASRSHRTTACSSGHSKNTEKSGINFNDVFYLIQHIQNITAFSIGH